jgi:hypothetical protein
MRQLAGSLVPPRFHSLFPLNFDRHQNPKLILYKKYQKKQCLFPLSGEMRSWLSAANDVVLDRKYRRRLQSIIIRGAQMALKACTK